VFLILKEISKNTQINGTSKVRDDQDDIPIMQLRTTRQRRKGGSPGPRHVKELPLPVEEEA
jgi:hypothetical protein